MFAGGARKIGLRALARRRCRADRRDRGQWQREVVGWVASAARLLQSGYIYHYAFGMIIGILVLVTLFVTLNVVR